MRPPDRATVLEYARPGARDEPAARAAAASKFKYLCAVLFSVAALPLGVLFAAGGSRTMYESARQFSDSAEGRDLRDGARLVACGIVLIGPGLWYGGIGLRGLRSGREDS